MAKNARAAKKTDVAGLTSLASSNASYLAVAHVLRENGDVVGARRQLQKVLKGARGPKEDQALEILAEVNAQETEGPPPTPEWMAALMLKGTRTPPKTFIFGALAATVFIALLTLARMRGA